MLKLDVLVISTNSSMASLKFNHITCFKLDFILFSQRWHHLELAVSATIKSYID